MDMTLPLPDYFGDRTFGDFYLPRTQTIATEAERFIDEHGIEPSKNDDVSRAIFGIDCQIDFCFTEDAGASEDGALGVPGASMT
jgi:hypothetical protein